MESAIAHAADLGKLWLGLGVPPAQLSLTQMLARGTVVLLYSIVLLKLGDRRLLGRSAGYDVMLVVVLGSVLSRAVNGQAAFFPTLAVSALMVLLHRLVSQLALRAHWLSVVVKGSDRVLIRDGRIDRAALRRAGLTQDDLLENLRLNAHVDDPGQIREARLERSGTISVLKRE